MSRAYIRLAQVTGHLGVRAYASSSLAALSTAAHLTPKIDLLFSREVKNAIQKGLPLVALESTIITHGMPFPQNVETAIRVENVIREYGAGMSSVLETRKKTLHC
jgi:hypothetical protein